MMSLEFVPLLSWWIIIGLGFCSFILLAYSFLKKAKGSGWRTAAIGVLILILINPVAVEEDREARNDVLTILIDESTSQTIRDRKAQTAAALKYLQNRMQDMRNLETRIIRAGAVKNSNSKRVDGTEIFDALTEATSDIPLSRRAGTILITDGQVHDIPGNASSFGLKGPFHVLLTGNRPEFDRRLVIKRAPKFGIVGKEIEISLRMEDNTPSSGPTPLEILIGDQKKQTVIMRPNRTRTIKIKLTRSGANIIQLSLKSDPSELTRINNRAVLSVNGVRERLRVLLVSGEPHPGERTWRNLLKADPSVDLVHFTILRPPEKQDMTPVRELSLIAFPVRELFEVKLKEFDLIIFDRYRRRGVLPSVYIDNIRKYVENGGAVLEASGPEFASMETLFATPLGKIFPGEPTGRVFSGPVRAKITKTGERHPITGDLPGAGLGEELPRWGKWFRQIEVKRRSGHVLMSGVNGKPLLIVNRVGKGRVAQLLSDHIWLWARGYDGGGPHVELLRRISHWLMKEPELDENKLRAETQGNQLAITRQSLQPNTNRVKVLTPSGKSFFAEMKEGLGGTARGFVDTPETGVYRIEDGKNVTLAPVGNLNPLELSDMKATDKKFSPFVSELGGGIFWLEEGYPSIRRVQPERRAAGSNWLGVLDNRSYVVRDVRETSLLPGLLALLLAIGALLFAWQRESR